MLQHTHVTERREVKRNSAVCRPGRHTRLVELDALVRGSGSLNDGRCGLTWDDLVYLPELRTLSCAMGVAWPAKLDAYVRASFARAGVDTYFDRAV